MFLPSPIDVTTLEGTPPLKRKCGYNECAARFRSGYCHLIEHFELCFSLSNLLEPTIDRGWVAGGLWCINMEVNTETRAPQIKHPDLNHKNPRSHTLHCAGCKKRFDMFHEGLQNKTRIGEQERIDPTIATMSKTVIELI
jgi:hypothetical protein